VRVQPPTQFASEFYDLEPRELLLPSGEDGVKLASWWKTASEVERRDLLHASRKRGLTLDLLDKKDDNSDAVTVEFDDDDGDDMLFVERFAGDLDEYEEDYA